jgi:hypothetical protein
LGVVCGAGGEAGWAVAAKGRAAKAARRAKRENVMNVPLFCLAEL